MYSLQNRQIILGITGGIAAYKSIELIRLLSKAGAEVRVIVTKGALEFVTPLTLQAVSGNPVHYDLLDPEAEAGMGHIELARWADLIVVAPASANFIARLANGHGDDLLTTVCLASSAPLAIAPAMNQAMWSSASVQSNMLKLQSRHVIVWGPASGEQACGDIGPGRVVEPNELAILCSQQFNHGLLAGKKVVITAGPTRERLDPVRYISNFSSGKMGYAIAQSCVDAGADVTLISGPCHLPVIEKAKYVAVESAQQMYDAAMNSIDKCDIFVASAAVVDYRPESINEQKIKKQQDKEEFILRLTKNPDILASIARHCHQQSSHSTMIVGFAAETENVIENATSKLQKKQLDLIIANDVSRSDIGFNQNDNCVTLVWKDKVEPLEKLSKKQLSVVLTETFASYIGANDN